MINIQSRGTRPKYIRTLWTSDAYSMLTDVSGGVCTGDGLVVFGLLGVSWAFESINYGDDT
jgi:hypothetical protein